MERLERKGTNRNNRIKIRIPIQMTKNYQDTMKKRNRMMQKHRQRTTKEPNKKRWRWNRRFNRNNMSQ